MREHVPGGTSTRHARHGPPTARAGHHTRWPGESVQESAGDPLGPVQGPSGHLCPDGPQRTTSGLPAGRWTDTQRLRPGLPGSPGVHRHEHSPTGRQPPPTGDGARAVPGGGPGLGKGPNRRAGGKTGPDPGIRAESGGGARGGPDTAPRRGPSRRRPRPGLRHTATPPSDHPHGPVKGLDLPGSGTRNTGSRGGNPDTSCQATPHRRQDNRPGTSARLPVSQPRPSPQRHALATSAPRYAKGRQLSLTQSMHWFMSKRSSAKYPCHGSSSRNHAAGCPPSGFSGVLGSTIAMKDTPMTAGQSG
ncbi:hypothetical protein STIB_74080 [Streptomyces sp. IB2014 011-1]|nr:hypothetical protein STIB_74080 [Streptomyces sp. IB2014 011-1]